MLPRIDAVRALTSYYVCKRISENIALIKRVFASKNAPAPPSDFQSLV